MPKELERNLKKQYGADSAIPYKIMNKMGYMHGNKTTAKGRALDRKDHPMMPSTRRRRANKKD